MYYVREAVQLRVVSYEADDVLYAVGGDVVTVEVEVLQSSAVVQRCDDAFKACVVQSRVA